MLLLFDGLFPKLVTLTDFENQISHLPKLKCQLLNKAMFQAVDNRVVGSYCTSKLFQDDVSWQKNKSFQKKPSFIWISKKPNWVTAEWCWRLRVENTMEYFVKISRNNNKISHCVLNSQPSAPFSCDSIWLLWTR